MTDQVKLEDVDLEAMKVETEKLRQGNEQKSKSLMNNVGRPIDPGVLAAIKVEVFIETFLDDNAKTVFAHNFQVRMRKEFDEALKELRQSQLTIATPPGKLHIPR